MKVPSIVDELKKHRALALERAKLEADFEHKMRALKKVKETLVKIPDLDAEKVYHICPLMRVLIKTLYFEVNLIK